ncbi:MAG: serine/threonine protein kinase [Myxococcales bacterium]|nr:serine/threonine protein kinase [Myxococcales bacterium]
MSGASQDPHEPEGASLGPLAAGAVIDDEFVVVRPLDEGGMGAVYVATQKSTAKLRALKVMHRDIVADAALKKRFEQEAKVGARVKSEHVVEVIAAGVDGPTGLPYLAMELLEGQTLRERVDVHGPLPPPEIKDIFGELCHAMAAAHEAGVVHRDLKPENVFLARPNRASSAKMTVKVLDFGIARLAQSATTRLTRGAMGSPMWMAPEQTAPGDVTAAADVWALGLLAYLLFTGKHFWRAANDDEGTSTQLLREIVLDPIPRASDRASERGDAALLPAGFDAWFARAVAREPGERFASAGEAWAALQGLCGADALAITQIAIDVPLASLDRGATGAATPFGASIPPTTKKSPAPGPGAAPRAKALPAETPVATVQDATPSAPPPSARPTTRAPLLAGVAVALVGVVAGVVIARGGAGGTVAPPNATVIASASAIAPPPSAAPSAAVPTSVESAAALVAVAPSASSAPAAASALVVPPPASAPAAKASASAAKPDVAKSAAPAASSAAPRPALANGYADPSDRKGAVTWKMGDRRARLFTRLVKNDSNVSDGVVRGAIEWSSWQYLRCYERAFASLKDMPEGEVLVSFDIIDQLPRHAKLVSSTFSSASFNDCVVGTLVGQTINAAGPDGKGSAIEGFRFVPVE